jgi:hypothetical protein
MSDFFWFFDDQRGRIAPLLPTNTRGMARIRGLGHGLGSLCRRQWRYHRKRAAAAMSLMVSLGLFRIIESLG